MKKTLIAVMVCFSWSLVASQIAEAQYSPGSRGNTSSHGSRFNEPSFRVQLGEFQPDGESQFWDETAFDFDRTAKDFEDTSIGLSYIKPLGPRLSAQFSGLFYEGIEDLAYIRFEDRAGGDILHTTEFELAAVTLGLIYKFGGPNAALIPYVGAGGGIYSWRLTEFGDFVDLSDPDLPIFDAFFEEEDDELGAYLTTGLEVPLADTWSIFAEARWDSATADLRGDFRGLGELDLSGRSYSAGLSFSF